jgi:hypothetical protein
MNGKKNLPGSRTGIARTKPPISTFTFVSQAEKISNENRPSTGGGVTRQACQRIAYTDFGEDVTGIGGISFDLAAQAIDIHL